MKKFDNLTESQKEQAIKVGTTVPDDAIGLGFFSFPDVSPGNNLTKLDISETIPENRIRSSSDNESFIAYADEFGVLRTKDGKNTFPGDDLTIGDLFIDKPTPTGLVREADLNSAAYVHYYYVSKFFVAAPSNFSFIGLSGYLNPDNIKSLNIKVIDSSGNEYIDKNSGRRKYRISLEPFSTEVNQNRTEKPHRVIVLLDSDNPVNLQLVYDKVEVDEEGNFSNQILRYTETINAVTYYQEVPEEAFVMDPNYSNKRLYSLQRINQKYADIITQEAVQSGYQIVTPRKAIKDHRTYEAFNWRLVARTRNNLNLDLVNYGSDIDSSGNIIQRTVKVAVLYSSANNDTSNSVINPYIFYRLESSPFNLSKYTFINPKSSVASKNLASYWKLDIDSVTDLSEYDVLAWSPTSRITDSQAQKINNFMRRSGTLVLDLSAGNVDASLLNPQLARQSTVELAQFVEMYNGSPLLDPLKNGGWNIVPAVFERNTYSVIGSNKNAAFNSFKKYLPFKNYAASNSFIDIGTWQDTAFLTAGLGQTGTIEDITSITFTGGLFDLGLTVDPEPLAKKSQLSVGLLLPYNNTGDTLSQGNLVATAFPLMSYCNTIYRLDNLEEVLSTNFGDTADADLSSNIFSPIVEGPLKLLYNTIAYGLYCRSKASSVVDIRSSLYNFVTRWRSSWVMDDEAMFEDEKASLVTVNVDSNTAKLAKDLTPNHSSVWDFYKEELSRFLPPFQQSVISRINPTDVEFFIEVTNLDVEFVNSIRIDSTSFSPQENMPSSYSLFRLEDLSSKLFAYTDKPSPKLNIPSTIGAYIITDEIYSSSEASNLENSLSVLSNFKSYSFNFDIRYTKASAVEKPIFFDVSVKNTLEVMFSGTLTTTTSILVPGIDPPDIVDKVPVIVDVVKDAVNCTSAIDSRLALWTRSSSNPANCFLYSGDIDIHGDARIWKPNLSPVHEYVKYIQFTVGEFTGRNVPIDGDYGNVTAAAVRAFQISREQRYIDGTVDSETKSYMAWAWKILYVFNRARYDQLVAQHANTPYIKYVYKAIEVGTALDIGTKVYKKLSFSGFAGPSAATDIIYFEIPEGFDNIDKVVIEPDSDPRWRNYYIGVYKYSATPFIDLLSGNFTPCNLEANTADITLNMGGVSAAAAKYMCIYVHGRAVSGLGRAEGFSIKSIKVHGKVSRIIDRVTVTNPNPDTWESITNVSTIPVKATVVQNTNDTVDFYSPVSRYFDTKSLNTSSYISKIEYHNGTSPVTLTFEPGQYYYNSLYNSSSLQVRFWNQSSVTLVSSEVQSITSQGLSYPTAVSISHSLDGYTLQTSSVFYGGSALSVVSRPLGAQYYLRDVSGRVGLKGLNTVTVNDGLLLLCDQAGLPYGMITEAEIRASITTPTSVSQEEIDMRYGILQVKDTTTNQDGFIYGFYDLVQQEFLGQTISFIELVNRGPHNVYIAVCAIDADGNTQNKNEYFGPGVDMKFIPVNTPRRTVVPVFSVKYTNSTAIKLGNISPNLSKFDVWELPVTNGSFNRIATLPSDVNYTDWKEEYKGQSLLAVYSTTSPNLSIPSSIYGVGYYDISDEEPVIVNDKIIQVRKTPILSWNHPSSYFQSGIGIVRPEVDVYTRVSISSPWVKVLDTQIRDINCATGQIEFEQRIVPSNPDLIKVSYVTPNKDVLIRQADGVPVPLNPVINSGSVRFNTPMYVYLNPTAVFKRSADDNAFPYKYVKLSLTKKPEVSFTFDSGVFNKGSNSYDPLALAIAVIYVTNNPYNEPPNITDIRVRGGGLQDVEQIAPVIDAHPGVLSHWDVYPPSGKAYPRGGYVVIRMPESIKGHFVQSEEIYNIIRNNLTAGVVFDLQDLDGNNWS